MDCLKRIINPALLNWYKLILKRMKQFRTLILLAAVFFQSCNSISTSSFTITEHQTGMTGSMRGVDVVNKKTVWISGSGGEFCTTSDGGENWKKGVVEGAEDLDFRDVHGFSSEVAVLMSAGPGNASRIYKTEDSGESWRLCYTNQEPEGFFDGFDFFDQKTGVMFSDPVDTYLNLLFTEDGGESWKRFQGDELPMIGKGEYAFAASGTSLRYDDGGGIWLVTGGSVSRIWHTVKLGKKWEIWDSPSIQGDAAEGLFSIAPRSSLRVVAVGGNYVKMDLTGANVIRQHRAGQVNWEVPKGSEEVPFMECVRWISNYDLLACGPPGVWYSSDNGINWEPLFENGFHAMDVSESGRTAWLAGNNGSVSQIRW
jgi:photosystem II stability/assembly factor-like uncharacterized protein